MGMEKKYTGIQVHLTGNDNTNVKKEHTHIQIPLNDSVACHACKSKALVHRCTEKKSIPSWIKADVADCILMN